MQIIIKNLSKKLESERLVRRDIDDIQHFLISLANIPKFYFLERNNGTVTNCL